MDFGLQQPPKIYETFDKTKILRESFNHPKFFVSESDKMRIKLFVLLIALSFAAKQNKQVAESGGNYGTNVNNGEKEEILVKIEEDEYAKVNVTNNKIYRHRTYSQNILRKKKVPLSLSA